MIRAMQQQHFGGTLSPSPCRGHTTCVTAAKLPHCLSSIVPIPKFDPCVDLCCCCCYCCVFASTGLLTLQLAITAAVTAVFCLSAPVKTFVWSNPWTFWTPFAASLALVVYLSCSETARRSHPTNIIVLLLFTACEAVLVGTISAMYDTQVVLLAALMTVGVTASLSLYAMQTKRDFTASGG